MYSTLRNWREHLTPVLQKNDFSQTGQLSPDEFVLAGDALVKKYPTWTWQAGDKDKLRDFLPSNKQYLITKNITCQFRAESLKSEVQIDTEDGFVNTFSNHLFGDLESIPDIAENREEDVPKPTIPTIDSATRDEDLPDMDQLALPDDDDDPDTLIVADTVPTRTYDIYITYDKYYRTPRVWLHGWSETNTPLSVNEVWQDISGEHGGQTVTMESFPHSTTGKHMASIHPCKHSSVMKVFIDRLDHSSARAGVAKRSEQPVEDKRIRVDQYLILFLQFVASITPTLVHHVNMEF
ncbi:Autophagy-related protein 3 [Taphrina deformans PYCC 5710]|uniref:Autophagy-related protein 3 n=1 Tax=Taphrina deformans (strain PYCC 5710 / ATCC 11124 / CBS 356.35 / IMI 108563 / JCM 9778 / NBRC 8474) TaxID=1097556 RepID=R4XF27_TAPDE|nr:Autophagy-related protein 3 [Taphrina deformans PYCC 5710]|eukprot:CCG83071.1 Autophagy-related protein 3 [Taphrina deformans PYCC 5710]